jgi:hypothetical protein
MTKLVLWSSSVGDVPANLAFTNNFAATVNPTVNNDTSQGYQSGSTWINSSNSTIWECVGAAKGAAVWIELAAAGGVVEDVSAAYNAANNAVGFTATGAQISGGSAFVCLDLTGAAGGAANVQLPTVAALVAAIPNPVIGDSYVLRIRNFANTGIWTVTTNTGWTLNGAMTIAATPAWTDFIVSLTSLTAATLQRVGAGTVV